MKEMGHGGCRHGAGRKKGINPPLKAYVIKLPEEVILHIKSRRWVQDLIIKAVQDELRQIEQGRQVEN